MICIFEIPTPKKIIIFSYENRMSLSKKHFIGHYYTKKLEQITTFRKWQLLLACFFKENIV